MIPTPIYGLYYTAEQLAELEVNRERLVQERKQRAELRKVSRVPFKHTASVWVIITLALLIAVGYGVSKLFC